MSNTPAPEKKRILVIDDEPDIRETLSTFLTQSNFQVKTAQNTGFAENLLAKDNFDLVITDLSVPTIFEGLQIITKIKKRIYSKHIPIIVISGNIDQKNLTNLIQLGVRDILTKPVNPQDLLTRISSLLSKPN